MFSHGATALIAERLPKIRANIPRTRRGEGVQGPSPLGTDGLDGTPPVRTTRDGRTDKKALKNSVIIMFFF